MYFLRFVLIRYPGDFPVVLFAFVVCCQLIPGAFFGFCRRLLCKLFGFDPITFPVILQSVFQGFERMEFVAVVLVSFRGDFSTYYPFYQNAHGWHDLLIWELLYFAQFAALEFFFRGFMLHPLKRCMGAYAIFVMVVPYCMIHFGKPFLECFAAIIAGVVLGTLSLRTRSIWCGAMIHMSVAITMDVAALAQTGQLQRLFI